MFALAHLSDPHLAPLPRAPLSALANKRFFGWLSWTRRRHRIHRPEVLAALVDDLRAQNPDHIAVTGDLTNIALEAEFQQARDWLQTLGEPDQVSVVPGNHDAYVRVPWESSVGTWQAFMTSDQTGNDGDAVNPVGENSAFPFVRLRGLVAVIGLTTAHPSPPFCAYGTLGRAQLDRLAEQLRRLGEEGRFRAVLIHHPPAPAKMDWRKRLVDAEAFREVLVDQGAELVLHGHDHTLETSRIEGGARPIPVFGVPSASAVRSRNKPAAHYQIHSIERRSGGWRIRTTDRGLDPGSGTFRDAGHREMDL